MQHWILGFCLVWATFAKKRTLNGIGTIQRWDIFVMALFIECMFDSCLQTVHVVYDTCACCQTFEITLSWYCTRTPRTRSLIMYWIVTSWEKSFTTIKDGRSFMMKCLWIMITDGNWITLLHKSYDISCICNYSVRLLRSSGYFRMNQDRTWNIYISFAGDAN